MKRAALAILLVCLGPTTIATFAQTSAKALPTVVFIGDAGLVSPDAFAAHSNWIDKTSPVEVESTFATLVPNFQADVVSLHPAYVHIFGGAANLIYNADSSGFYFLSDVTGALIPIIQQAKAANIKVILGTIPPVGFRGASNRDINAWIMAYGAANGITVVNYHDLLCSCIEAVQPDASGINVTPNQVYAVQNGFPYPVPAPLLVDGNDLPTAAGLAAIAQYAETAIEEQSVTLKSGYLTNPGSVNSFLTGIQTQFTAMGEYSDGQTRAMLNTNFTGGNGVWTTSNPTVMYVDQQGNATSLAAGKARISFRSFSGKSFYPWDVTVTGYCGQFPCAVGQGPE